MANAIPLFDMLTQKMSWLSQRQSVLAQNVANADTPGYSARDLTPINFEQMMSNMNGSSTELTSTSPMHISPQSQATGFDMVTAQSEGSPTGNAVSLEQEIMKLSDTQIQYQAATNIYRKAINMFQIALSSKS
jgi:flagellar basal-body rod protein FlgB